MSKCLQCNKSGLFLKVNQNGLCSNCENAQFNATYTQFKDLFNTYKNSSGYENQLTILSSLHSIGNTLNPLEATKKIVSESQSDSSVYYTHPLFGIFFKSDKCPFFTQIMRDITQSSKELSFKVGKCKDFSMHVNAIPRYSISISDQFDLVRNTISDMPEIKTTSIGKTFNKEKLFQFVVLDLETTGLHAGRDRIVEISAIKYEEWEPIECFTTLINPIKPIPAEATAIHGITNDMVLSAPVFSQVTDSFFSFCGDYPIVAHNLPFDLKFLYVNNVNFLNTKRKLFDTLELSRKAFKKRGSYSLDSLCNEFSIYRESAHRSLSDCYATGLIFFQIVNEITEHS